MSFVCTLIGLWGMGRSDVANSVEVLEGMSRIASLREAIHALGNSSLEECWKWSIFHVDQACCKRFHA